MITAWPEVSRQTSSISLQRSRYSPPLPFQDRLLEFRSGRLILDWNSESQFQPVSFEGGCLHTPESGHSGSLETSNQSPSFQPIAPEIDQFSESVQLTDLPSSFLKSHPDSGMMNCFSNNGSDIAHNCFLPSSICTFNLKSSRESNIAPASPLMQNVSSLVS